MGRRHLVGCRSFDPAKSCRRIPPAKPALATTRYRDGKPRSAIDGLPIHVFTHMSHIYTQGASIYTTYVFPNGESYEETMGFWKMLKAAVSTAVVESGGTISHQHGVGRDHAPYLNKEKGPLGMKAIETLQGHFDPGGTLNPGVLIPGDGNP